MYVLFNPTPCVFDVIPWIRAFSGIQIHNPVINQFIQCYSADFFWAVSFAFILQSILMLSEKKTFWLLLSAFLGIAVEIMQLCHVMKGVFDPVDIVIYMIGAFFVTITVRLGGKENEENYKQS